MRNKIILALILSTLNLIVFRIYEKSVLYCLFILIQSFLLFIISEGLVSKKYKDVMPRAKILAVIIFLFLSVSFLKIDGFTSILRPTYLETDTVIARKEFYAEELGRVYRNRIGILFFDRIRFTLTKFTQNMFSYLDFNLYFNYRNLSGYVFLAMFTLGLYSAFSKGINKFILYYFLATFIVGGLLNSGSNYGFFIYLPLANLTIVMGALCLKDLTKNENNKH